MRKIFFAILVVLAFANANAQMLDPVKWTTKIEKKSENKYLLIFNGVIENEWHMYSQFTPEGGPLPMEVIFKNQNGNFNLIGKAKEGKTTTAYNDIFEVNETFFVKTALIQQEVLVTNLKLKTIEAELNYQVCKESCINLEKKFTFNIPATEVVSPVKAEIAETATPIANSDSASTDSLEPSLGPSYSTEAQAESIETSANKKDSQSGLWAIFFVAFLSGFAALLTPCVFPMIPMTVSFFTKQSKNKAAGVRNAIIYGISIIFIYVVLGLLVTWIFGADALNALSTNVWFNLFFFVLLVIFAISFLGAFEIMLPNSWANKVDSQADRGGIVGILFMALDLAIVSFSCTGPIVGTLLVEAASKGGIAPVVGMLGFSFALALPFMFFAMFRKITSKKGRFTGTIFCG